MSKINWIKTSILNYSEDELDVDKIDLKAFYTKNQVDELIKEQKAFTLSKQMKLYDDLIDDNVDEIYRGPVSKFVNKGYVATEYDKETETMILDWPDEIGTLPPEALQNNPQIGDFTHAATADFSAKQQKRITSNENEIIKLNSELIKTNENINDIKNNWFNIATSPLWKKINNEEIIVNQWYIIDWIYTFMDSNQIFTSVNKLTKTNVRVSGSTKQNHIVIENIDVDIDEVILWFDFNLKKFTVESMTKNYEPIIYNIYQYQGTGTPTEFIAEDSTEHDYYTKQETNELLDKKQNIDDNNLQTTVKQIVPTINENKSNIDKKQDKLKNSDDVNINKNNTISIFSGNNTQISNNVAYNNQYQKLNTNNKTIVGAINENKTNIDKKQDKLENSSDTILSDNRILVLDNVGNSVPKKIISTNKYPELITTDKTIVGAINELKDNEDKKQDKENWTIIGKSISNREYGNFQLDFYKLYRTYITWEKPPFNQVNTKIKVEFKTGGFLGGYNDTFFLTIGKIDNEEVTLSLKVINHNYSLIMTGGNQKYGNIFSLEELQNTVKVNIIKPFKINSKSLKTNEIEENNWDIELKENPTTHCQCPKWKDVAISLGTTISYKLKPNTYYKIFYDLNNVSNSNMGKYPMQTIEIFWQETSLSYWVCFLPSLRRTSSINIANNNFIKLITDQGYLWKLQELQE